MELLSQDSFDVLVVQGLDQALLGYEDTKRSLGWDDAALHNYDPRDVPKILHHLNQLRECWYEQLLRPVVFVVPPFVVRYLILRCPDFYDWRVGTFVVSMDHFEYEKALDWAKSKTFLIYKKLSISERLDKIAELHEIIKNQELDSFRKAELLVDQGLLWASGKEYSLSLSCFAKAIEIQSGCERAYRNQAAALSILGREEEALASYDKALEIKPDYHEAWSLRGDTLLELGREEEAIISYEKAIEIRPDNVHAWDSRGDTLHSLGRYDEAIASYDKAIEIKPNYLFAWSSRGLVLTDLKRYEEAEASYRRALAIEARAFDYKNLGDVLRSQKRYDEAIASYDKALEIDPNYRFAWSWRGLALQDSKYYKEAEAAYRKALAIEERSVDYRNLADTLKAQRRYTEALISYEQAIKLEPDNDSHWYSKGVIFYLLGHREESLRDFEKAIEINPDDEHNCNAHGFVLRSLGKSKESLDSYNRVLELNPNSCFGWYNRGVALEDLGQNKEAQVSYQKALEVNIYIQEHWYALASTYSLQGKADPVLLPLKRAIEIDPSYRDRAAKDPDFDPIRHDPRFQALINPDQ
ncbi:MAG: tetratricopeptide repeat protein [Spirulina sp. SIO3F2]|nr:tetratricopeptide repeat protein [Spirulina sp. SIO3F2]